MVHQTNVVDGNIYRLYWCSVCFAYLRKYYRYDDLISEGELIGADGWDEIQKELEVTE